MINNSLGLFIGFQANIKLFMFVFICKIKYLEFYFFFNFLASKLYFESFFFDKMVINLSTFE